ncbi:MAG: ATP-dependent DNA helicase, partial [Pseudomonadota bacterium]
GRSNYLCRYRLELNASQDTLVGNKVAVEIVRKWAAQTRTGDISEVDEVSEQSPVWRHVTSTSENCLGSKCPDYSRCFVVKARQRALEADVVVVNHHLFFSDLNLKQEGFGELLPNYDAVVFDEAHNLVETASRFFGFSLSFYQIRDLMQDIRSTESEEKSGVDFSELIQHVAESLQNAIESQAGLRQNSLEYSELEYSQFPRCIEMLQLRLSELEVGLDAAALAGEGLHRCLMRLLQIQFWLDEWIHNSNSRNVRWLETGSKNFRLHSTPLDISPHLSELLESTERSWIFTSATLAVGTDFSTFVKSLGLETATTRQWPSPFDFEENSLLLLPEQLPDPRDRGYVDALEALVRELTDLSGGRCFCLFTSYAVMERMLQRLQHDFNWPVLVQGEAPKSELIRRFETLGNAVLLATASFWEGVDIKGSALSCVIIDKLPFASPSDPVLKRRLAICEEEGGNPFMEIQISSAVIALKQGAGRLIRSETDRGVLAICDNRLTRMRYGSIFLGSLPPMPRTTHLADVAGFFSVN